MRQMLSTRTLAVALTLTVALIAISWARARAGAKRRESFRSQWTAVKAFYDAEEERKNPETYDDTHVAVFEAFLRTFKRPPTEAAMTHYVKMATREKLDGKSVAERMRKDMPQDMFDPS